MEIRPIKTEEDYKNALNRIEEIWGAKKDTAEGDELDLLATLVEAYEIENYSVTPPDPVEAIIFRMEQMGLTEKDLAKYLGSIANVKSVLERKKKLTLDMIKSLNRELKIPAEVLLA